MEMLRQLIVTETQYIPETYTTSHTGPGPWSFMHINVRIVAAGEDAPSGRIPDWAIWE